MQGFLQRLGALGTTAGEARNLLAEGDSEQSSAHVVVDGSGDVRAVWTNAPGGAPPSLYYGEREPDGDVASEALGVLSGNFVHIDSGGAGTYIALSTDSDADPGIVVMDANERDVENAALLGAEGATDSNPIVAVGDNSIGVMWWRNSSEPVVQTLRDLDEGWEIGAELRPTNEATVTAAQPALVALPDGFFLAIWPEGTGATATLQAEVLR